MAQFDSDEIENYRFGSPLWAGDQDPILHYGVNENIFWNFVLLRSRGFAKHLDSPDNRATAVAVCIQRFGTPVVASELSELILKLISIQYPGFTDPNAKPAEPVDTRPRDKAGRLMSPKAILWQQYEAWVADPETSMKQINEKRRTDSSFAEFYSTMGERQRLESKVGDEVTNLNANRDPQTKKVPEEVQLWAQQCRLLPVQELRRIMSPAAVGSIVAAENKRLFDIAVAANLL
jgi:hypothetical protein